ncbi:MAG: sodium/glutamate symporter, partial [Phycisphaerales bacterium]
MEYMQVSDIAVALVLASLLLLVGRFIRQGVKPLHKYYVPTSVIAGTLGLLLGPQVLGAIVEHFSDEEGRVPFGNGIWAESTLGAWSELPAVLISLVFAGLFVGKAIPKISTIWKRAGPMVAHGQTLAWGQYVVGLTLAVALFAPVWEVDTMSGALIEIGFEGGHGTAAGLAESFRELGFENGAELALGLATVGVIAGVLIGTLLINWGVARGHIDSPHRDSDDDEDAKTEEEILGEPQEKPSPPDHSVDTLSIHLALIAASIGVGADSARMSIMSISTVRGVGRSAPPRTSRAG